VGSPSIRRALAAIRRSRPPWRAGEVAGSGSYSSCWQRLIDERAIPGGLAGRRAALPIRRRWINAPCAGILGRNDFNYFYVGGVGDDSSICSHRNDHCWYAETGGSSFRDQDPSVSSPGPEARRRNRDFQCRTHDCRRSRGNYQDLRGG